MQKAAKTGRARRGHGAGGEFGIRSIQTDRFSTARANGERRVIRRESDQLEKVSRDRIETEERDSERVEWERK